MSKNILAIIPASGRPTNRIVANSSLPDAMLPINGKPVIGYIVEDLLSRQINRIVVVLNKNDSHTEKYLVNKFGTKSEINVVYNSDCDRGCGFSISLGTKYLKDEEGAFVYLGDTIYNSALSFNKNFLLVSKKYESSEKWCFVEEQAKGLVFKNKPISYSGNGKILCGLYFFKNGRAFKKAMLKVEKSYQILQVSHIIEEYAKSEDFKLVDAKKWYDCGNIENYYKAKMDFLKVRNFNSTCYNDLYSYITKSSKKIEKIENEINWYKNIPADLKIFTPRLIDFKVTKQLANYSLEFYGYQSLGDLWVFGSLNGKLWQVVINRLFDIVGLFKKYKAKLPLSNFRAIYYNKTLERLETMRKEPYWQKIMAVDYIEINGKKYKNINFYQDQLKNAPRDLYNKKEISFIHGDFCLSNILFDPGSRIFKFIDPRGSFGKVSVYGDIKYDLAKLRHSFSGFYDFLISDMFELKEHDSSTFSFTHYVENSQREVASYFDSELVKRGYDVEKIKLIEALLFLSMIPLHNENPTRQKAMYLTGIKLLNNLIV